MQNVIFHVKLWSLRLRQHGAVFLRKPNSLVPLFCDSITGKNHVLLAEIPLGDSLIEMMEGRSETKGRNPAEYSS